MDSHTNLLTLEAKIDKVKKLLPKSNRRGRFFIPDNAFYVPPVDDDGLKSMAKQLAQWAGFKPSGLEIAFSKDIVDESVFDIRDGKPAILINSRLRNNPFACGNYLATGLMRYYFEFRKQVALKDFAEQQTLIDMAVIYAGFGLVTMNHSSSFWQQKYPKSYTKILLRPDSRYRIQYTRQFARENGLELGAFARYLCPWAIAASQLPPPLDPMIYAKRSSRDSRRASLALIAVLALLAGGLALYGYRIANRPKQLSLSQLQEKEAVDILRSSHERCLESVAQKEKIYDGNSDFFVMRNLNGDRMRCTSIRNLHNSHVENLNSQLQ